MSKSMWAVLITLSSVACGNAGGENSNDTSQQVGLLPACEPSDRMPLEGRPSPFDSITFDVGDGKAKICYGRPSLRGRLMIGGQSVPYDTLWRTGANEPTTLHVTVPVRIAGMEIEPGAYSIYTVPHQGDHWTLIVNRSTSQWGHESNYTPEVRAQEVGRADVQAGRIEPAVEQLTLRAAPPGVVLEWQNSRVLIPIEPVP